MDRYEQHVGSVVKDVLRAVAMMEIDVENCDAPGAAFDAMLRSDRGVVQIAIATHVLASGMMPGRAAQRECGTRTIAYLVHAGERRVGTRADRIPGTRVDRRTGIHREKAELAIDELRHFIT